MQLQFFDQYQNVFLSFYRNISSKNIVGDVTVDCYIALYRFGQAKFPNGGSVLGSSQFSILPQLPQKAMIGLKGSKLTQQ